ncbi:MAG: hypothetical protein IJX20_01580 [Alphaproteobacteria bacterium]|nr:hypothetical protein [Alphaproteobacteria bacterium]
MNRCDELQGLIQEGYNLKASAYLEWLPNIWGQMTQVPVIDKAELIKWNTKIDLFFQKTNSPIRNLRRNEFPDHNIVQYMDIKLKRMEGLLESWKNEDTSPNKNTVVENKDTTTHKAKISKKKSNKKKKKVVRSTPPNIKVNIQAIQAPELKTQAISSIIKIITTVAVTFISGGAIYYFTYIHVDNNNSVQQQNQINDQKTIVNINIENKGTMK